MTRLPNRRYDDDLFLNLKHETLGTFLHERYYRGRNETIHYNYETLYLARDSGSQPYIDINLILNVPREQEIIYAPGMLQILKFAWI